MKPIGVKEAAKNIHQHWGKPSGFYKMPAEPMERYLGPAGRAQAERDAQAQAEKDFSRRQNSQKKKGTAVDLLRPVTTTPRRPRAVPPMSAKRRAEAVQYQKLRYAFLLAHPRCERLGCGQPAVCVHHTAGRRENYLKVETWKALCNGCHEWAHRNITKARAEGLFCDKGKWR